MFLKTLVLTFCPSISTAKKILCYIESIDYILAKLTKKENRKQKQQMAQKSNKFSNDIISKSNKQQLFPSVLIESEKFRRFWAKIRRLKKYAIHLL